MLAVVVILGKEVYFDNKFITVENYLLNNYYSIETLSTAMHNKLGDSMEEKENLDWTLSDNFDNYVMQLILDDINQYETEELAFYNMYLNEEEAEAIVNVIETPDHAEVQMMGDVCYIKITGFTDNIYKELKEYDEILKDSKKIVIDLRNNTGGYLNAMTDVMSLFYEKGSVAYTEVRSDEVIEHKTKKKPIVQFEKIVFLCNGYTASSSEVMIFNMKSDFPEQVDIVGTQTYGKNFLYGYKQFGDGELFMFVSSLMGNSASVTFDNDGIVPDYIVDDEEALDKALEILEKM